MRAIDNKLYMTVDEPDLINVLTAMSIAGMGGFVGWLRRRKRKNFGTFFAAVITAAFTGLLSHLLTDWLALDTHLQYAISGAAGYSGGALLDAVSPMLVHMLHRRTEDIAHDSTMASQQKNAREIKSKAESGKKEDADNDDQDPNAG